jgi:hypothetical protein
VHRQTAADGHVIARTPVLPVVYQHQALLFACCPAQVRDSTKLLRKVQVMGGDISLPGLGLSAADRTTLLSSVDYIVHCAADIRLEADIQVRIIIHCY